MACAVGKVYCFTFEGQGCSRTYGSCIDLKAQAESIRWLHFSNMVGMILLVGFQTSR